jgi:CHASE2 domain-containing sensor protein
MVRVLLGLFVVAHGLVTGLIWMARRRADAPFDAAHSWLLGDRRDVAVILGTVVATGFVVTGVGYLLQQDWWPLAGVAAGGLGVVFMVVYFNPWLLVGIAISGGIAYAGADALQAAP